MKHLATINREFAKLAVSWEEWSRQRQQDYLGQHPKSKRRLTAELAGARKSTKAKVVREISDWVKNEEDHKKLAVIMSNFLRKYAPEEFYEKTFTSDEDNIPDDIYDRLVEKYDARKMIDEESGDAPETGTSVIDEQSETVLPHISGQGEYLRVQIATGIHNFKRVIIIATNRSGMAPVTKDGEVISQRPYNDSGLRLIVSK